MAVSTQLYTVNQQFRHQIRVRKSSFIGTLVNAEGRDVADQRIDEVRREFADATHNCFAWRIDRDLFRYSDDGEPSSTAGKPILSMIDKYQLTRCALIVTRYYGGVKLGVGGLVQAYGQCAEETIQAARRVPWILFSHLRMTYGYEFTRQVEYLVDQFAASIEEVDYGAEVTAHIKVASASVDSFEEQMAVIGNGRIMISRIEEYEH